MLNSSLGDFRFSDIELWLQYPHLSTYVLRKVSREIVIIAWAAADSLKIAVNLNQLVVLEPCLDLQVAIS